MNMELFNIYGLIFVAIIMIPNVIFAIKCKDGFENKWNNKLVETMEQIGRFCCFGFMIINIPKTYFGWWGDKGLIIYLIGNIVLVTLYCLIWFICFKKNSVFRALALSIIPSIMFLFSGIISRSILLIIASIVFAPSHIMISYNNAKKYKEVCYMELLKEQIYNLCTKSEEKMSKILIVEDDEKLRNELKIFLNNNGFETWCLEQFENPIENILKENGDLILLDINLPNSDGEYICKEIRKVSNVPIIMVTSRDNEIDELISLNNGADQYITKPYNIRILLAKVSGLLKRSQSMELCQNKINYNGLILDISKSIIEKENEKIELTKNELKIFHFLLLNKDKIISRDELMDYLWESESFIDDNTLSVNIKRLRNKLEELGMKDCIETKRGQGYILK